MATRKWLTFDNFSAGWVSPAVGYRNLRHGQWSGRNLVTRRDGSLVVRKGARSLGITGVPTGNLWGWGSVQAITNNYWFVVGNRVFRASGGAACQQMGTLAVTPSNTLPWVRDGIACVVTVPGDKCYRIDPFNNTFTPFPGSPGGQAIAFTNGNFFVADGHRVRISAFNDLASWPDDIPVGDPKWAITALVNLRNDIWISKPDGWYILQWASPTEWSVRRAGPGPGLGNWAHAAVWQGHLLAHTWGMAGSAPYVVTSATSQVLHDLEGTVSPAAPLTPQNDLGMASAERAGTTVLVDGSDRQLLVCQSNGAWTYHEMPSLAPLRGSLVEVNDRGHVFLATTGGPSTAPMFFTWEPDFANTPGHTSDATTSPGDHSSIPLEASLVLPEIVDPQGSTLRPLTVVVDVESHRSGTAHQNNLQCRVVCTARDGLTSNELPSYTAPTWTDGTQPDTGGSVRRVEFQVGVLPEGNAFRVEFPSMRGVAIRSVQVCVDGNRPTIR